MQDLLSNKKYFDECIKVAELLYKRGLYEDCALFIRKLGLFAWKNFTGYYTSYRLEKILRNISNQLIIERKKDNAYPDVHRKTKKVLHVVTEIYEVGGHTKLLNNWIKSDTNREHSIASTIMDFESLSFICSSYTELKQINQFILQGNRVVDRAAELLKLAKDFDCVILHIHPNDIIPVLAFSNRDFSVPVLFLNHAEHTFWFGVTISDAVVQIRESNIKVDTYRRQLEYQYYVPVPVLSNKAERQKTDGEFVILSTGAEFKYKPDKEYNFFRECFQLVERYPQVIIYIAGVNEEFPPYLAFQHNRIKCLGIITNLNEFEDIADLYLEGFPTPSFTSLLQPAMKGVPFILHYNPLPVYKIFEDHVESAIVYPKDLNSWKFQVCEMIENKEKRNEVGIKQLKYISDNFSQNSISKKIEELCSNTEYNNLKSKEKIDRWFNNENENAILNLSAYPINHFENTVKLNIFDKLKLLRMEKNNNVIYYDNWKEITYYLINNY